MRRVVLAMVGCVALDLLAASSTYSTPPQDQQEKPVADSSTNSSAQPSKQPPKQGAQKNSTDPDNAIELPHSFKGLGERFLLDQKQIWTSPAHLGWADANWLIPVGGLTAGMFATDADLSRHISHNASTVSHYNTISNASLAAILGGAGAMWLLSYPKHQDHWRETGFLAGEAALNSLVVIEAMKYPLGRERPYQDDGSGHFFHGGVSFPSEHSAAAWAAAGVIAHEYHGPLTKIVVYGLATLVDYSRFRSLQHFPSDIFVGSLIGNLVAENVYNQHHNPALGGSDWDPFRNFLRKSDSRSVANMGSPNVPLDSWIYPAMDRLAALGFLRTEMQGMRPWTRLECVRLLDEAGELLNQSTKDNVEANYILDALNKEFDPDRELVASLENRSARLESAYSRVTGISGPPLSDGYDFGQTITDDFGRPYQEGVSNIEGFSGWVTSGPLVSYARAEYEHAPSAPALPLTARQAIYFQIPHLPSVPPDTPIVGVDRLRLLDGYIGLTLQNWEVSYGKQTLWWGPTKQGPLMFSDNASPVAMFRVGNVSPFKLPSILGWFGPIKVEWLLGQFSEHNFVFQDNTGIVGQYGQNLGRQPFIQGQKLSFKPTRNFEFSVSLTVVFSGGPTPLTFHYLLKSYSTNGTVRPGNTVDSGDGRSGMDFVYKIPGLRDWLSFYGTALSEDEYSPLGYPRKSVFIGGLYMPHLPGIPKLDLRVEGGSTVPPDFVTCHGCTYVNNRYPNGYTNAGNLIGSSLGRGSQGEQAWSTYWFTPRNSLQFSYRHQKVDSYALPGGGTINDAGVQLNYQLRPTIGISGLVQYEKWNYPVLAPGPQTDITTSLGITFAPVGGRIQKN